MVDLLWKEGTGRGGDPAGDALERVGHHHDFKLLCGYSMGNFYKAAAVEDIHEQHSHLIARNGETTVLHLQMESATSP